MPAASSVTVPAPALVRLPVPLTVPKSESVLAPVVRVAPEALRTIVLVAVVVNALIVSLAPRERVVPAPTETPEVVVKRPAVVVASVPAVRVVAPVKVLAEAPPRVRVPAPSFVMPPRAPEITPFIVTLTPELTVRERAVVPRPTVPLSVRLPALTPSPKVRLPPMVVLFASV